jgi:hypothetical protein
MLWLMVGGPFHGTWKDIDESLFNWGFVNLPEYDDVKAFGRDHTPKMVSYFKQTFDVIPPHQYPDRAYITVLVSAIGVIDDLPDKVLHALCKAIGW